MTTNGRGHIDHAGLESEAARRIRAIEPAADMPFALGKISHVVLKTADLERSARFYVETLGLRVSDVYPETMVPGGMVFMRCNDDHHGVALVGGGGPASAAELHHYAFETETLDEVFLARDRLESMGVEIVFEGRRRAGQQIAIEFKDPDGHNLEICWGMDRISGQDASRKPEAWVVAASLEEAVRNAPEGQDTNLADRSLLR